MVLNLWTPGFEPNLFGTLPNLNRLTELNVLSKPAWSLVLCTKSYRLVSYCAPFTKPAFENVSPERRPCTVLQQTIYLIPLNEHFNLRIMAIGFWLAPEKKLYHHLHGYSTIAIVIYRVFEICGAIIDALIPWVKISKKVYLDIYVLSRFV